MTRFRAFRNDDAPALVQLWNEGLPDRNVVKPLSVHELDALVMCKPYFDRMGLIVAERDDRIIGFSHAGFGPHQPEGPSTALDTSMGTIAMLAVEPGIDDAELESGLVSEAELYLRSQGAQVLYAGGQYPMNPFYWGLYGGSEFAGIVSGHQAFHRAVARAGYQEVSRSLVLELDLIESDLRDPRLVFLRRQNRIEFVEDVLPSTWWEAQAIGLFRPSLFRALSRDDDSQLAQATTWEIAAGYGVGDGRPRTAVINIEVDPAHRRKGLAQLLFQEIARTAREQLAEIIAVQTSESNLPARALYDKLGFEHVDTAILYRKPASS